MSNSLFRKNSRSSRILDLVEQNNKTPENSHQLTQSLSVEEDRNFKSDSPLPPNCNLGEDDFAVLESMIDEELSQDRTCISESLIIVPGTPPKKVSRSSFGSFILDSNDNTPLPSPMADFDSNTQVDQNDVVTSQIEEGSSVCPSPTPVVPCVMPPSIDSLITCSPLECDSPINRNGKRKATYKVNPGKKRSRRVENWIDTKRKTLLNSGQEYTSRDGKVRGSKKLGPVCPSTCKLECFRKFSTATRENIHTQFWKLANHSKQWEYINKFSEKHNKRRLTTEGPSRRQFTSKYFLPLPSEEFPTSFERVPVCLKMFTSTLSITDQFIRTAHSKLNQEGATLPDNRGKHGMHPIKIDESMKRSVCDHISALQPVESHYTRKSSAKLYLDGNLTMNKLTELYKEWDQLHNYENTIQTVRQYRDIVNEKMNIAFHVPKKDLCDKCHAFFSDKNPTEEQIEMHSKHIENKTTARQFKENDKRLAQDKCPEVVCATFDFQKILTSPHGDVGLFYYKRKLSVYHFTVFDLAKKEAWCYMWTEYTAKRGANEVSSCLKHFMKNKIDEGAKSFLFWSDNCSGQNRNRVVYSMYMLMSQKHNVDIIHRFLEQGHTQNEGDSVHALIERESKGKIIYTPDQWYALVRWAKTNGPSYKVIEVAQEDIFDFKPLLADRNWKKDTANENICWNKLKEIKVKKEEHNCLYLKYNFQADSHCLKTLQQTRRKRRINGTVEIKNLYSDVLPLPEAKYKDLMALCKAKLIPTEYHRFFQNLKHGGSTNTDIDSDISEE